MTRPLRDRLGEAIRRCRIGLSQPLWADLGDDMREQYRKSADAFMALGDHLDFVVEDCRP